MIRISTLRIVERLFLAALVLAPVAWATAEADVAGSRDHPLFNRMAGFWIDDYQASDFNSRAFRVARPNGEYEDLVVEGRKTEISYRIKEGAKEPSSLAIVRNYAHAVTQAGGRVAYEWNDPGDRMAVFTLTRGGREIWAEVRGADGGGWYGLAIVEKSAMAQEITASDIYDGLARSGRVALYILFDTGKATIRPESQAIVRQVVDMMKAHPELKVAVEGHTDNVGTPAANLSLSDQRAKAVMGALAAQGVAPARLAAAGFGQDRPVADNATEDGRAKNRRVELVRR